MGTQPCRRSDLTKRVHVVGLNASPRRQGNCAALLDAALAAARQAGCRTSSIMLNDLRIKPCQACAQPAVGRPCVFNDGMRGIYAAIDGCDAVILASPVYFGSVSAQAKLMIDRFQCRWQQQSFDLANGVPLPRAQDSAPQAGKKGATGHSRGDPYKQPKTVPLRRGAFFCVQAGSREDFFVHSRAVVKNWFATINAEYTAELMCPGFEAEGSIAHATQFLEQARKIARKLISC